MISRLALICSLLLPVLVGASTAQPEHCADSYAEFEKASVGSNVSGDKLKAQLFRAFYTPNQHLPFAVYVTYELVLTNGTRYNLSSDQDCSTELWAWTSSPVFLFEVGGSAYTNLILFCAVNYFTEWDPPHITITTTLPPCPDKVADFLSQMTASLKVYSLGQMESKTNLGYVKRGCGVSTLDTLFVPVGEMYTSPIQQVLRILTGVGFFFQVLFVWMATAVLLKMTFTKYAKKTYAYSYDVYGMLWGLSATAFLFLVIVYGFYIAVFIKLFANMTQAAYQPQAYFVLALLFITPLVELPVAIYAARKATVAVPCIFRYPATLLCCGRRRAECLVTAIALWVNLTVLQLVFLYGLVVLVELAAAPIVLAINVMLIVLALSCIANIFSLLFTISAHFFTPADQRKGSNSIVLRAVVVLPLLLMILCYGGIFSTMASFVNMDADNKSDPLFFITSIIPPILLGMIILFLKKLISDWLKWSPENRENEPPAEDNDIQLQLLEVQA